MAGNTFAAVVKIIVLSFKIKIMKRCSVTSLLKFIAVNYKHVFQEYPILSK